MWYTGENGESVCLGTSPKATISIWVSEEVGFQSRFENLLRATFFQATFFLCVCLKFSCASSSLLCVMWWPRVMSNFCPEMIGRTTLSQLAFQEEMRISHLIVLHSPNGTMKCTKKKSRFSSVQYKMVSKRSGKPYALHPVHQMVLSVAFETLAPSWSKYFSSAKKKRDVDLKKRSNNSSSWERNLHSEKIKLCLELLTVTKSQ